MRAVLAAAVWGLAAAGASATERTPVWTGWAEEGHGGAADCTDCFEDEYVLLGCERGRDEVRIELIGMIPPEGAHGQLPVTLAIGAVADRREARLEFSEMLGAVPVLTVTIDDPLLARLRTGKVLTLSIEGDRLEIPLAGVDEALEAMLAGCR